MNLSLVQMDIIWESPEKNLKKIEGLLSNYDFKSKNGKNVIILPEMFTTGFTMNAATFAEKMGGKTIGWMKSLAFNHNSAVVGSIIIKENEQFFNRMIWVNPDESIEYYDKRHLFGLGNAKEHEVYTPNNGKMKVVNYQNWRFALQICYDLRFPVYARNQNHYDCLIYIASWPHVRSYVWRTLLQARAAENYAYVAGVNRVGKDGNSLEYWGDSGVIDFMGKQLITSAHTEAVLQVSLNKNELKNYKNKFPVWKDADDFSVF